MDVNSEALAQEGPGSLLVFLNELFVSGAIGKAEALEAVSVLVEDILNNTSNKTQAKVRG